MLLRVLFSFLIFFNLIQSFFFSSSNISFLFLNFYEAFASLHSIALLFILPITLGLIFYFIVHRFFNKNESLIILATCIMSIGISFYCSSKTLNSPSPFYYSGNQTSAKFENYKIAHAGGEINSHIYTNSLESVIYSLEKGLVFVELDLRVLDQQLVAIHDNETFKNMTGLSSDEVTNLSHQKYSHLLYFQKYHPITTSIINELMTDNDKMILVTDKINNYTALKEKLPFQNRMIIEAFNQKDYDIAKAATFPYVAFSITTVNDIPYVLYKEIPIVTLPRKILENYPLIIRNLHKKGVTILVYRSNEPEFFEKHHGSHFSLLYTDSLH